MSPSVIIVLLIWNMLLTLASLLLCYCYMRRLHNRVGDPSSCSSTSTGSTTTLGPSDIAYEGIEGVKAADTGFRGVRGSRLSGNMNKYDARGINRNPYMGGGSVDRLPTMMS